MENTVKSVLKTAGAAFALCVSATGLFGAAVANASSSHESNADVKVSTTPPAMKLSTSPDEQIRTSGMQGTIENADQGIVETADQCTTTSTTKVDCVTPSAESVPQYTAKAK